MKTKFYGIVLLISLVGLSYGYHIYKVSSEKKEMETSYEKQLTNFQKQKKQILSLLHKSDIEAGNFFNYNFDLNDAKSFSDTTISFFVFSDKIKYNLIDFKYLKCLELKSKSESINLKNQRIFNEKLASMFKKHGEIANEWVDKLDKSKFFHIELKNQCKPYFSNNNIYKIKENCFLEYDKFLVEFKKIKNSVNSSNNESSNRAKNKINQLKNGLSPNTLSMLDEKINEQNILKQTEKQFSYNWKGEGLVKFSLTTNEIDNQYIDETMDDIYTFQYRDNSLSNGSMPYSYCYGSSNNGNSGVKVTAGPSDVLVLIKNMNERVIRHAYVKSYRTFSLNVPNGSYNVYFYYGTGWNPKRFMKDTDCGRLTGGFISDETVTKDPSTLTLFNQIMQYTLQQQVDGNFSTSGSSKYEAF
jgi:hypothetical protein